MVQAFELEAGVVTLGALQEQSLPAGQVEQARTGGGADQLEDLTVELHLLADQDGVLVADVELAVVGVVKAAGLGRFHGSEGLLTSGPGRWLRGRPCWHS